MKHLPLAAALAVLPALAWGQTYPFPNAPYAGEKGTGTPSTSDQILVQQGVTSHDPVGSPARMTLGTLGGVLGANAAITGGTIAGADVSGAVSTATGGAVARTAAARAADVVNVKDFGAKGDGVTNDTAAIQLAITDLIAAGSNFSLRFPCGTYVVSSTITATMATAQGFQVSGDGAGCTTIAYSGAGTDLLDITLNPGAAVFAGPLVVRDITLRATAAAGYAINASSTTANSVSPQFSHLRVTYTGTNSFANGIKLANLGSASFDDVRLDSPNATGVALAFDGNATFPDINTRLSQFYTHNWATALQIGDGTNSYVQGVALTDAIMVGPGTCVRWHQGSGSLADMLLVSNSHCNPTGVGFDVSAVMNFIATGNYILPGAGGGGFKVAPGFSAILTGNSIFANAGTNIVGVENAGTGGSLTIDNNQFYGFNGAGSTPIIADGGSISTVATNNICKACGSTFVNTSGSNTAVAQFNNLNGTSMSGGMAVTVRVITSALATNTASDGDVVVVWNGSATSAKTQTIPGCTATFNGRVMTIKDGKGNAGTYNIAVAPATGTIDGAASASITTNYGDVTAVCDGNDTNWLILSSR